MLECHLLTRVGSDGICPISSLPSLYIPTTTILLLPFLHTCFNTCLFVCNASILYERRMWSKMMKGIVDLHAMMRVRTLLKLARKVYGTVITD
jgi:hypothetical protein